MKQAYKLFRYCRPAGPPGIGWIRPDGKAFDLTDTGQRAWTPVLETEDPLKELVALEAMDSSELDLSQVRLLSPLGDFRSRCLTCRSPTRLVRCASRRGTSGCR